MKTYTTLEQLVKDLNGHQLTAQEVINSRTHVNYEWQDIELSDELKSDLIEQFIGLLGGRYTTQQRLRSVLTHSKPQHWGLRRIIYVASSNRFAYYAGQDYPAELAQIRTALSK